MILLSYVLRLAAQSRVYWLVPDRVLLSHPRGGGGLIQGPTHPEFWHTHRPTNAPPPPRGGGADTHPPTHPPTHPRTQLRHAIQKTKFFTEVNNHHVNLIVSVAPFASSTNDKAS